MATKKSNLNNNGLKFIDNIKHPAFLYRFINWVFDNYGEGRVFTTEFKKLFYKNEIGELYGEKNGNFWKIVVLYVILFVSVGFGIESKKFFNKQLDNPFVRFLPVLIEGEARLVPELVDSLQARFLKPELIKKYHLDTLRSISIQNPASFVSDFVQLEFDGLADDHNSPLVVEAVCSKENGFVGKPFTSIEDRSVIVTLDLLKDLYLVSDSISISELTTDDLPGFIMFKPSFFSYPVPLILQGVAEQLPYGYNFLLPTKYNDHLYSDPTSIYYDSADYQVSFYIDTLIDEEQLRTTLIPVAEENGISTDEYNFYVTSNSGIHSSMLVSFGNVVEKNVSAQMLKNAVIKNFNLDEKKVFDAYFRKYDFPGDLYASSGSINQATKSSLLIVFDDLKGVKSFNEELKTYSSEIITKAINIGSTKQRKGIEMEMTNVNMRFILNIIEIIVTSFLIIIGILAFISLMSFIRVLFEKYFQKIEKNIGTFMAFGINIKVVYSIMLTIFIYITVAISLVFAFVVGFVSEFLMIKMLGNSIKEGLSLFSLYNIWTFAALFAIVVANYAAFRKASKKFNCWPGDIINDR